jgi:acyl-coenzyme A thioesterase PaaI-like protein
MWIAAAPHEVPVWDAVKGWAPLPAAAATLGWELLSVNPDQDATEVAFTATDAFLNLAGVVQGGFLAAKLDDRL